MPKEEKVEITNALIRAKLDCLIFFRVQELGGYYGVKLPNGKYRMETTFSVVERLNFPSVHRVGWAVKRVRKAASNYANEYRLCVRRWHEARNRYCVTHTKSFWEDYVADKNYRTTIAIARRGGEDHYRKYICPYLVNELKPRIPERRRARREMKETSARIKKLRVVIFEAMDVPEELRQYA